MQDYSAPPPKAKPKHRKYSEHKAERIVAGLIERFNLRREINKTYGFVGERPMFGVLLTDQEQWERWTNPEMRKQILQGIAQNEGEEAIPKYVAHMATIDRRLHGDQKPPPPGEVARRP